MQTMPEDSVFLSQLKYRLLLPSSEAEKSGLRYNVPLMNSLVLYVGIKVPLKFLVLLRISSFPPLWFTVIF